MSNLNENKGNHETPELSGFEVNIPIPILELMESLYGKEMFDSFMNNVKNEVDKRASDVAPKKSNNPVSNQKPVTNATPRQHACECNHSSEHKCNCNSHNSVSYGATNMTVGSDGVFYLETLLPGFKKENIKISYLGETLTIEAKSFSKISENLVKHSVGGRTLREDFRSSETVKRSFTLKKANFEDTKVSFEDGILYIEVPTRPEEIAKEIVIS